jgi:hypothetical protein
MKTIEIEGYKINICTDIIEWGIEFYGIPRETKVEDLDNKEELLSEIMGFAEPTQKQIWVFIPYIKAKLFSMKKLDELYSTIAHELGHIVEQPEKEKGCELDSTYMERKANFYENFWELIRRISVAIINEID